MIRVGIIGCGKIAQVRHLPEYAANPNAQVVAYHDKNRARAEEMPPNMAAWCATATLTC